MEEEARSSDEKPVARESVVHRMVDSIAAFSGTVTFLLLNVFAFTLWISINTFAPAWLRYDQFPFNFLTLSVSLEAIFLSIFVLISQNRQAARDKAHDEEERKRQQALMQEDLTLNRKEEAQERELLVLINEVKVAQEQHREILERVATLMETKKSSKRPV